MSILINKDTRVCFQGITGAVLPTAKASKGRTRSSGAGASGANGSRPSDIWTRGRGGE